MEQNASFYDSLSKGDWQDLTSVGPSGLTRLRKILSLIVKYNLHGEFFEAGCGTGHLLPIVKDSSRFKDVKGSDFSIEAVKSAQKKGFDVCQMDLVKDNVDPHREKYDVVVCSEVLEHIEKDLDAMGTLRDLLKKHGKLIISVPFNPKHWTVHDQFAGHVRRYDYGEMNRKLESVGFRILESEIWGAFFYNFYYTFILSKTDPSKLMNMNTKTKRLKILVGKLLYFLFILDDFFAFSNKGRRQFLIAEKL